MITRHRFAAAFLLALAACARPAPAPTTDDRPRLAVLVVVDQLREPLLERYDDLFTGGLRRLIDEGRVYTRATHDHARTVTAAGHATLATGTWPMHHGIVGNEWWERTPAGWTMVSNVGDSTVRIVDAPTIPGVSPHYLQRSGIAEWMLAADSGSRIASVSLKDRGAVLPAGRTKGQVYWFEPDVARFVTSTYYRNSYPDWVTRFNTREVQRLAADTVWTSTIPAAALARSLPDTMASEGNGVHTFFPHRYSAEARNASLAAWLETTPMLDALALRFARTAVEELALGRDAVPDFLNVSLSQTDRIGHAYGPNSREMLDNLLRLDRGLGEFLAFLDARVGRGRWVLALSADHGSVVPPEGETPGREPLAHRVTAEERQALRAVYADSLDPERMVAALKRLPFVADAWTSAQLMNATPTDSVATLFRRSMFAGREGSDFGRWGVEVNYTEGFLTNARGTSHGRPYWYDRHVPLIFFGPGIARGRDSTRVSTTDLAPTLARLARVAFPSDVDGKALPVGGR
jgi:predicted AlkP superfamily pyrophosphatase or phosphodiesterase